MSNSIFNIGLTGLNAAQAGLLTTSNNISNVSTPGYSRQQIIQGTSSPQFTGSGYLGQGTTVDSIRRVYDSFLTTQVQLAQAASSQQTTYAGHTATLDSLFGDAQSGLTPSISDFFSSVNGVAANPSDTSARQVMLTSAQSLAGRFNDLAGQLSQTRQGVNQEISGAVTQINSSASQLAALNQQIAIASAAGGSTKPPNDLLDKRDALLASLNQQVGATAVTQSDGSLNVYLANGQPLVVGQQASTLVAQPSNDDAQNLAVGLQTGSTTIMFRDTDLTGGVLGGALQFRTNVLDPADDKLGGIALSLASSVNAQQSLGLDLNGQPGAAMFNIPAPDVTAAQSNTGTGVLNVSIASATALTGSNYKLKYDGTNYTLTRLSDNTTQTYATLPQTVDGLTLGVGGGAVAAGDSFLIQPVRNAARNLGVALTNVNQIAAASPVRTAFSLSNAGSATISGGSVDANYLATPLAAPLTLTYTAATGTFSGFPATQAVTVTSGTTTTTYPAGAPVPYTAGATMTFGGISVAVSGAPSDGDTFTVAPNSGGSGDGSNAVALGALSIQAGLVNGTATLTDANAQLTSFIGTMAQQAQSQSDASASLLSQSQTAQQSLSGVNLDEEAANLQKYQQDYQAAGKVMAIADTLFQSILAIANS